MFGYASWETIYDEKTRVLLIEGGSELEAGIPPNLAILVASINNANHDVRVFSLNDYKTQVATGDEVRVNTLQVPPSREDVIYKLKDTDIKEDFKALIKEYQPHIVGLTATEPTYLLGKSLIELIGNRKDILKIAGGAHVTINPDLVIKEKCLDAICVGEGDELIVTLCDRIKSGEIKLDGLDHKEEALKINNLTIKQPESQKMIKNPTVLLDVNKAPFQDWSAWPVPPRASKAMQGKIRKTALIELTRGCPYKCTYCANVFFNKAFKETNKETGKGQTFYREKKIDNFIKEVIHLRDKYGIEYVYIGDETIMTTSKKRFEEFVLKYPQTALPSKNKIIESTNGNGNGNGKINGNGNGNGNGKRYETDDLTGKTNYSSSGQGIPFWCQTRPEAMTYDRVKGFRSVGMQAINVGVESGNEEFRKKKLHRRPTNEAVIHGMVEGMRAGTIVGANVIIGFPGETRDMIFESIEMMRQVKERATEHIGEKLASQRLSIMVHLFQPYAGTPMRDEAIKMGLIPKDYVCGDYRMDPQGTGYVSPEELKGLQRTFNLYVENPKETWGDIKFAESFSDKGNEVFFKFGREYQLLRFGRTSFDTSPDKATINLVENRT